MVFKTLSKSVREYKASAVLTSLFMVGEVMLECLIPLVMAQLINGLGGPSMSPVVKFGCVLIGMAMTS